MSRYGNLDVKVAGETSIEQGCVDIWACTAPHNNKYEYGSQKYVGVGGHLFAIAADKSLEWGHEGALHGFAANTDLLEHYMSTFGAEYLGMLHQYQFFINEVQAKKLLEVYQYEWNAT